MLPVAERLATSSDCYSKTGPRSSACLILTLSQSCEVKWDCHLYGWLLISSLLMTRWHIEPGHHQAWYWLSLRVVKWSEIVTHLYGRLLIWSLLMTWWPTEPGHQQAWYWPSLLWGWSEKVTCMDTVTNIKPAHDLVTYWAKSSACLVLT